MYPYIAVNTLCVYSTNRYYVLWILLTQSVPKVITSWVKDNVVLDIIEIIVNLIISFMYDFYLQPILRYQHNPTDIPSDSSPC